MNSSDTRNITAVILAGGRNSRFGGRDKAFVPVDGVPMIGIISSKLEKIFEKILVVSNSPESYGKFNPYTVVPDIYKGRGPLGGIHAAMSAAGTSGIFVVSCDMPFISMNIVESQVQLMLGDPIADAVIPRISGNIEPLHAIYSTRNTDRLGSFLETSSDYSIRAFLLGMTVKYLELPPEAEVINSFTNINSPGDL